MNDQVISLLDVTATTLAHRRRAAPAADAGPRSSSATQADPPRHYAFGARDRIDETVQRIRSVRDARYRYIRNFTPGPTFASLNRYKEKCFLVMPLMRELQAQGKLTGPPADLMALRGPSEELYDTRGRPARNPQPRRLDQAGASRGPAAPARRAGHLDRRDRRPRRNGPSRPKSSRRSRRKCTTGSARPPGTNAETTEQDTLTHAIMPNGCCLGPANGAEYRRQVTRHSVT